jgi:hypothetical protein
MANNDSKRFGILDDIDDLTTQDKMDYQEAIEFLEELSADIDGRIETLREENEE